MSATGDSPFPRSVHPDEQEPLSFASMEEARAALAEHIHGLEDMLDYHIGDAAAAAAIAYFVACEAEKRGFSEYEATGLLHAVEATYYGFRKLREWRGAMCEILWCLQANDPQAAVQSRERRDRDVARVYAGDAEEARARATAAQAKVRGEAPAA